VACSADQGCPAGWTCGDNPNGTCSASSNGTTSCTADPPKICLPPYFSQSLGGAVRHDGGLETSGNGTTTGAPSGADSVVPTPASKAAAAGSSSNDTAGDGGCSVAAPRSSTSTTFGFAALALAGLFSARRRRAAR
jgi:MYXO-CTERM domain-containing protein